MRDSTTHEGGRTLDARFSAAFQPGFDPASETIVQTSPEASIQEQPRAEVPIAESDDRPGSRNPFIVALWIVSGGLVMLGIVSMYWASSTFYAGSVGPINNPEYVLATVVLSVAPWFITIGIAAAVGVLFIHAIRWGARA